MDIVLVSSICVFLEFLFCITWFDVLENIFFLMELIVEHVFRRIQFGLIILVVAVYFVVWFMASPICSDFDPLQMFNVDDGKFPA